MLNKTILLSMIAGIALTPSAMATDLDSRLADLSAASLTNGEMDSVHARYLQEQYEFMLLNFTQANPEVVLAAHQTVSINSNLIATGTQWQNVIDSFVPAALALMPTLDQSPIMDIPSVYVP